MLRKGLSIALTLCILLVCVPVYAEMEQTNSAIPVTASALLASPDALEDFAIARFANLIATLSPQSVSSTGGNDPVDAQAAAEIAPWLEGFSVVGKSAVYDASNRLIGYTYPLRATDGTNGYITVGASTEMPPLIAYSFDAQYPTTNENSYFIGGVVFMDETDAAGYLEQNAPNRLLGNHAQGWANAIGETQQATWQIAQEHLAQARGAQTQAAKTVAGDTMKSLRKQTAASTVWDDVYEPNGQDYYATTDFDSTNHCGPVCALNLAQYWKRRGQGSRLAPYNEIDASAAESYFDRLYTLLDCNSWLFNWAPGVVAGPFRDGIEDYFSEKGSSCATTSIHYLNEYKDEIANWSPVPIVNYFSGGTYRFHWILGLGWKTYADGYTSIKVNNGWDSSNGTYITIGNGSNPRVGDSAVQVYVTDR